MAKFTALICVLVFIFCTIATAQEQEVVANRLLVRLTSNAAKKPNPGKAIGTLKKLVKDHKVKGLKRIGEKGKGILGRWFVLELDAAPDDPKKIKAWKSDPRAEKLRKAMKSFRKNANVEYVEPDYIANITVVPDDLLYPGLYGMKITNAEGGWDITTGSDVVIAVIDTGVDYNHEDLAANMWTNPDEKPDNGIDDDGNGYVDDYYGWDFANGDSDPMDDHGHGSHCSGTVGAVGNNGVGVVGVNWVAKIMAVKFLRASGSGSYSDAITSIEYAAANGARILSNSWGGKAYSRALEDVINEAHSEGVTIIAAAGNDNADALFYYPAGYDRVITVSATDHRDNRTGWSNWGSKIHVAAPGLSIMSVAGGGGYTKMSGTSMACPHVAGLAGLLLAENADLTNLQIEQLLAKGADDLGLPGKDDYYGYGRINIAASMALAHSNPLGPIILSPPNRTVIRDLRYVVKIDIEGEVVRYTLEFMGETIYESSVVEPIAIDVSHEGKGVLRLTAFDADENSYEFGVDIEIDNITTEITAPRILISKGIANVIGTSDTRLRFTGYAIEWSVDGDSWSNEGVTLAFDNPVQSGLLGTIDTTLFAHGQTYTIRLTTNTAEGISETYSVEVLLDSELVTGWPNYIPENRDQDQLWLLTEYPNTSFADLDSDGQDEVVVLTYDGILRVYNGDGTMKAGFPVYLSDGDYSYNFPPTVADIDADGDYEIITYGNYDKKARLHIITHDGKEYPGWSVPVVNGELAGGIRIGMRNHTPICVDIDADGQREIVYGNKTGLFVFDLAGELEWDKPIRAEQMAIMDMNSDGKPEIAVNGNQLYDNEGNLLWSYTPERIGSYIPMLQSFPSFADIDGDGMLEIFAIGVAMKGYLYGWRMDGELLPGFPYPCGDADQQSELVIPGGGDVDDDNIDEIVTTTNGARVFDLHGLQMKKAEFKSESPAVVANVDSDPELEIVSVSYPRWDVAPKIWILDSDGSLLWSKELPLYTFLAMPPTVADMDGNGKMEVGCAAILRDPSRIRDVIGTFLFIWELPFSTEASADQWPQHLHDQRRTSRHVGISAPVEPPDPPVLSVAMRLMWGPTAGVVKYLIERDGEQIAETTDTTYQIVMPADGMVEYTVAAVGDGSVSPVSNVVTVARVGGTLMSVEADVE